MQDAGVPQFDGMVGRERHHTAVTNMPVENVLDHSDAELFGICLGQRREPAGDPEFQPLRAVQFRVVGSQVAKHRFGGQR